MQRKRDPRSKNDDLFFGGSSGASVSEISPTRTDSERVLIVPQDVSGESGGGVPWYVWALLIAGIGYLILKQEKTI
jgi:hypothetical protein